MPTDYKEDLLNYKNLRNTKMVEEDIIPHKKKLNNKNKQFVLETVYKKCSIFNEMTFKQGKYCTLPQAKQALEQLKKNKAFLCKFIKEMYIYNINDKNTIIKRYVIQE